MGIPILDAVALAPAALLGLLGIWLGLGRSAVAWPMRWLIPFFGASVAVLPAALYLVANSDTVRFVSLSGALAGAAVAVVAFVAVLALLLMFMSNLKARMTVWAGQRRTGLAGRLCGGLLGIACGLLLAAIPFAAYETMRPDPADDPAWARASVALAYFRSASKAARSAASVYLPSAPGEPKR